MRDLGPYGSEIFSYAQALQSCSVCSRNLAESADDDAVACYNEGTLFLESGEYAEAIKHLVRAVVIDDRLAVGHANLGTALNLVSRFDEALLSFECALKLDCLGLRPKTP